MACGVATINAANHGLPGNAPRRWRSDNLGLRRKDRFRRRGHRRLPCPSVPFKRGFFILLALELPKLTGAQATRMARRAVSQASRRAGTTWGCRLAARATRCWSPQSESWLPSPRNEARRYGRGPSAEASRRRTSIRSSTVPTARLRANSSQPATRWFRQVCSVPRSSPPSAQLLRRLLTRPQDKSACRRCSRSTRTFPRELRLAKVLYALPERVELEPQIAPVLGVQLPEPRSVRQRAEQRTKRQHRVRQRYDGSRSARTVEPGLPGPRRGELGYAVPRQAGFGVRLAF